MQRIKAVFRKEGIHFIHGRPPVIVISLEDDLLTRKSVHKFKIRLGFRKTHAPGGIAGKHDCIFRPDLCQPVLLDAVNIVMPTGENIH